MGFTKFSRFGPPKWAQILLQNKVGLLLRGGGLLLGIALINGLHRLSIVEPFWQLTTIGEDKSQFLTLGNFFENFSIKFLKIFENMFF